MSLDVRFVIMAKTRVWTPEFRPLVNLLPITNELVTCLHINCLLSTFLEIRVCFGTVIIHSMCVHLCTCMCYLGDGLVWVMPAMHKYTALVSDASCDALEICSVPPTAQCYSDGYDRSTWNSCCGVQVLVPGHRSVLDTCCITLESTVSHTPRCAPIVFRSIFYVNLFNHKQTKAHKGVCVCVFQYSDYITGLYTSKFIKYIY